MHRRVKIDEITAAGMHGFAPGDVVCASSSDGKDALGNKPGTRYVVARVVSGKLTIRRMTWWRRLYAWLRRRGLDLGAP